MQRWRDSVFRARWIDTRLGSSGAEQWCHSHVFFSLSLFYAGICLCFFFRAQAIAVWHRLWFVINEQISFLMLRLKYWCSRFNKNSLTVLESRGNLAPLKDLGFFSLVVIPSHDVVVIRCQFLLLNSKNNGPFSVPLVVCNPLVFVFLFFCWKTDGFKVLRKYNLV